jgi:hypothetical protein
MAQLQRFRLNQDDFPAPTAGFVLTHFLVVADQDRSREFYRSLFDGQVLVERDRVIMKPYLNVARLVPHNEQDALLAAACPLPDIVAGVGHVFHRGEYWLLTYESCGHDQYFRRTADGLFDLAAVEAEVRQRYATCGTCAWAPTRAQLESLAQLSP